METADMKSLQQFGGARIPRDPIAATPQPPRAEGPQFGKPDRDTARAACASIERMTPTHPWHSLQRRSLWRMLRSLCGWCLTGALGVILLAVLTAHR